MNNKIMATVNSQSITMADVMGFIQGMGSQGSQYNNEQGYQLIVEQLVSQRLVYLDATKNGLAFDKEYKEQLEIMKRDLLTSYAINKFLTSITVTQAQCKEEYLKDPTKYVAQEKVNASHILVKTLEDATKILEQIKSNDITFEAAAKENSSCPSSENGGVLGEFARGSMVKEFEEVAFSIELDEISEPVKTEFGYHLIKVTQKTGGEAKSFEEIEEQINQQLVAKQRQDAFESKVNQLKILYPVDMPKEDSGIIV